MPGEARRRAQLFEAAAFLVAQSERLRGRQHAGHHAAAQAADAEAGRLLGGEDDQLDRASRLESKLLEDANGFEPSEHANAAIVEAGVGNRIDVRAGADGREVRLSALPAREGVADGVFRNGEAGISAQDFQHRRARADRPR